jgi:hypothetical protein
LERGSPENLAAQRRIPRIDMQKKNAIYKFAIAARRFGMSTAAVTSFFGMSTGTRNFGMSTGTF